MQVGAYQNGLSYSDTTPNIDRIANEGAKFMSYYAEQSCTAGRSVRSAVWPSPEKTRYSPATIAARQDGP